MNIPKFSKFINKNYFIPPVFLGSTNELNRFLRKVPGSSKQTVTSNGSEFYILFFKI